MTFGVKNIVGINKVHRGEKPPQHLFVDSTQWPEWQKKVWDLTVQCHTGHLLEALVALVFYQFFWSITFPHASEWKFQWVATVVAFNLVCEVVFYGFWHWICYVSDYANGLFWNHKYNPVDQYLPMKETVAAEAANKKSKRSSFLTQLTNSTHLRREMTFTTLGWLQSSAFQCVMMWLWASKRVPYYSDFWAYPSYSIFWLLFMTYWREFHFYWAHRAIHPWFNKSHPLASYDLGAFLYKHVHSLHHKSYNPGPWSGLAMHPVEHFIYYSCSLVPLVVPLHPFHFLYVKFHADLAPIGGHDGFDSPGGGAGFHWLHHAKYECNYGVPLINFDRLFGTWQDHEVYLKEKEKEKANRSR